MERDSDKSAHIAATLMRMALALVARIGATLAAARSGSVVASSSVRGVICHEKPQRSLHQPHMLSAPPLPTIAFQ